MKSENGSKSNADSNKTNNTAEGPSAAMNIGANDIPIGVIETDQSVLDMIQEMWAQGLGLEEIACHLEERGLSMPQTGLPASDKATTEKPKSDTQMKQSPAQPK